jgi:hypothetical protein
VEKPKAAEEMLNILGGGTRKSKELLRRKNDIYICTMRWVWQHKEVVSVAKGRVYKNLYQCLSMKEEGKDIYRISRIYERKTWDFNQVKYIKDETEQHLVKED